MKKIILTTAALAALATASYGQTLIAAWNFDFPNAAGGLDIDNSSFDFTPETSADANFGTGVLTWTGHTNGSGLIDATGSGDLVDSNQFLRPLQLNDMGEGAWDWAVGAADNGSTMIFAFDLTGFGAAELTFGYAGTGDGFDLNVNVNGVNTLLSPASDALATVDISALSGGAAQVVLSFTGLNGADVAYVDNFQIVASAIPEPSAFASILGVVVMGMVARRRR